jgi:hypothetical protein
MDLVRPGKRKSCDPGRADRIQQIKDRIRSDPRWKRDPITQVPTNAPKRRRDLGLPPIKRIHLTEDERVEIGRWAEAYKLCRKKDRLQFAQCLGALYRGASTVSVRKLLRVANMRSNGSDDNGREQ